MDAAPSAPSREAAGQGQTAAGSRGGVDPAGVPGATGGDAGSGGPLVGEDMHMRGLTRKRCCGSVRESTSCGTAGILDTTVSFECHNVGTLHVNQ